MDTPAIDTNNLIRKAADWQTVKEYEDITYQKTSGIARIAFNRPEVRNAFRPDTITEMTEAFQHILSLIHI